MQIFMRDILPTIAALAVIFELVAIYGADSAAAVARLTRATGFGTAAHMRRG